MRRSATRFPRCWRPSPNSACRCLPQSTVLPSARERNWRWHATCAWPPAEATFAIPTARLGIAVTPWTIRRLALLAGTGAAQAMLIGGESIDAARAWQYGLASRLGDRAAALAWARELAGLAPLSLAYAKKALNQPDSAELVKHFEACWASEDAAEGRSARAAKRPPRFLGR